VPEQRVTLNEAAVILGVDITLLQYLVYRGGQMGNLCRPKVTVSREHGQRIEYVLSDIETVVQEDAEVRLTRITKMEEDDGY
jgi:hypothetical protein